MHGYDTVCEIPLRAGADADAQTQPQKYATLHSAAFAGHVEVIKVLLAHDGGSGKQRRLHCSKKSSVAGWRN